MFNSKRFVRGTSSIKKKAKKALKRYEENWIHIVHLKGSKVENDDTSLLEGVFFKIDGYAEKAVNDQLFKRTTNTSKAFLEAMSPADKVLRVTGGNKNNSDGFQYRCPYWPLEHGNTEADLEDFLQKEVIPAIMETGMMHENSSFVFKSYTVVNHLTDVVDYDDDLRHVIRHYLADEVDFQEGNFFKASKNNLYFVFSPGCVPLEVMHDFNLTEEHLLPVDQRRQREAIEEANGPEVSTPMRAESGDSPNFNRSL